MAEVSLEKQFRGQCRLVKLLLWRQAESTDLELCFAAAKSAARLTENDERFLREAFSLLDALEAGESLGVPITKEAIAHLQRCVIKLNSADAA